MPGQLTIVEQHLRQNQKHIEDSARHISKQRRIIQELEENGCSTLMARELLGTFEQTFASHKRERERLMQERSEVLTGTNLPPGVNSPPRYR